MTRIRILHIELEGTAQETMTLVREALHGASLAFPVNLEVAAEPARSLPAPAREEPEAEVDDTPVDLPSQAVRARAKRNGKPEKSVRNPTPLSRAKVAKLGTKERAIEILRLLESGMKPAAVAEALGVTTSTVYGTQHRARQQGREEGTGPGRKSPKAAKKDKQEAEGTGAGKPAKGKDQEPPRFRCQHCGQNGTNPKRCDNVNCGEPR